MQPRLFYALFVVSGITTICYTVRHLLKTCIRQVVLDKWLPLTTPDDKKNRSRRELLSSSLPEALLSSGTLARRLPPKGDPKRGIRKKCYTFK